MYILRSSSKYLERQGQKLDISFESVDYAYNGAPSDIAREETPFSHNLNATLFPGLALGTRLHKGQGRETSRKTKRNDFHQKGAILTIYSDEGLSAKCRSMDKGPLPISRLPSTCPIPPIMTSYENILQRELAPWFDSFA